MIFLQVPQQSPQLSPWDLLSYKAGSPAVKDVSAGVSSPWSDKRVIEPVLKSHYLTKLNRLLPTFLEDGNTAAELEDILHNRVV